MRSLSSFSWAGAGESAKIPPAVGPSSLSPDSKNSVKPFFDVLRGLITEVEIISHSHSMSSSFYRTRIYTDFTCWSCEADLPRRRAYKAPVTEELIGDRLRQFRKQRGLTQAEVAQKLGINQTLVSQYENGKLRLHGALIAGLAKVLRVSADEILGLRKPAENGQPRDRRFLKRLEQIEKLPGRKKQALLTTIDAYLSGD